MYIFIYLFNLSRFHISRNLLQYLIKFILNIHFNYTRKKLIIKLDCFVEYSNICIYICMWKADGSILGILLKNTATYFIFS